MKALRIDRSVCEDRYYWESLINAIIAYNEPPWSEVINSPANLSEEYDVLKKVTLHSSSSHAWCMRSAALYNYVVLLLSLISGLEIVILWLIFCNYDIASKKEREKKTDLRMDAIFIDIVETCRPKTQLLIIEQEDIHYLTWKFFFPK